MRAPHARRRCRRVPTITDLHSRKTELTRRTLVEWIFASIWLMALPAWAVEYRLQVTNGDALTSSSDRQEAPRWHLPLRNFVKIRLRTR